MIIWRTGGLRSASTGLAWKERDGWTGFIDGNRRIEEPNPFSLFSKQLLSEGYIPSINDEYFADHYALMEGIVRHSATNQEIKVVWFKSGELDVWVFFDIRGKRLTPRETWVTKASHVLAFPLRHAVLLVDNDADP